MTPPPNLHRPITQAELPLVRFDTTDLLTQIRATHFSHLSGTITYHYGLMKSLACIEHPAPGRHIISLHSILNHPDTPEFVIRHILIHELIHIEIPPRNLREGEQDPRPAHRHKRTRKQPKSEPPGPSSHPPEFWEREKQASPENTLVRGYSYQSPKEQAFILNPVSQF